MFGIGGGFITTPMLIFLGVPPAVAVGTGTSQVVASSVSGALGHWSRGNVDVKMGVYLICGGLFGWVVAYRLGPHGRDRNHRLLPASARTEPHGKRVHLS